MTIALRRSWAKDLDAAMLYELLKLRVEVFVVEQATPYPELDGRDLLAETRHFWLETPAGEVISTLRLMEEHPEGTRVSGSAVSAPNAKRAATATAPGYCRRRWPRSATIRAGSTRRSTWRTCTPASDSSVTVRNSSRTAFRTCRW
jgi:hypothetical protein